MKKNRRVFLLDSTTILTLIGFGFFPASRSAWGKAKSRQQSWFENGKSVKETFTAMGVREPVVDQRVVLRAPDTAENGAYVGIGIESSIPNIDAVAVLVEKTQECLQVTSR